MRTCFASASLRGLLLTIVTVTVVTATPSALIGAVIYETAALGVTGVAQGSVAATNISPAVFTGVRFELTQPVVTSQVGGHFVSRSGGTFFGTIVRLEGAADFPNSNDLSSSDMLGASVLSFPTASAEVHGNLSLSLNPGWYALVFGSGLFGASGDGAAPRNNMDIGEPDYIAFQPGTGWFDLSDLSDAIQFVDHRFTVHGAVIPEPSTTSILLLGTTWPLASVSKSPRLALRPRIAHAHAQRLPRIVL